MITRLSPPPKLDVAVCTWGEAMLVCMTPDNTVALSKWIARVEETRRDLDRCPLVQLVDAP